MRTSDENRQHLADAEDIQAVRSRLVDRGLVYFAIVLPAGLALSLARISEHGWNPIYLLQMAMSGLIILGAVFRKRLSYRVRAGLLLGTILIIGAVGTPVFGLVGGGLLSLAVFAVLTAIAFGTRAGLVACAIVLVIVIVTGAAVYTGVITFHFDISEYATSITAWGLITTLFFMFVPVAVVALGVVHASLSTSLEDLRQSQAQHNRLVDNLIDAFLYRHDAEGIFNYFSSSVTQILGYQDEELRSRFTKFLTGHPVNQKAAKHSEESISGVQQPPFEVQVYHKDGSIRWLEVSENPVRDNNGKVVSVEGVAHDITDRKEAADQREKLVKTLKYKNKELQDIVYTASHDLRTPLVNIAGFSGVLKSDCDDLLKLLAEQSAGEDKSKQIEPLIKEEILQSLGFIQNGARKMASLLDGLLQISRIGTVKTHSESLDMQKIVREILDLMAHQTKESNISVTVEVLPGCIGDTHMLDHVVANLISNAIKYRDPAKESEMKISGKIDGSMSIYCVEDNGIGIAPEYQKKVFEIFHRLNPKDSVSGEGLGLAIVTRIMDRLNGKIWLESELGKGSKFFIALPSV